MTLFFLLGTDDPEMKEIERLLTALDQPFAHASVGGRRVHAGNAYAADVPTIPTGRTLVLVECALRSKVVDHHRPGDPGYDLPAGKFWEASSLGQIIDLLDREVSDFSERLGWSLLAIPERLRHIAAMDHHPAAAWRGECPGIRPEYVGELRVEAIAAGTGHTVADVLAMVEKWRERKASAPVVNMAGCAVFDFTAHDCGIVYSLEYLTLQEAAFRDGFACLLRSRDRVGEPDKVIATALSALAVAFFKAEWGPAQGLTGIYGVPERGYAGGYMRE